MNSTIKTSNLLSAVVLVPLFLFAAVNWITTAHEVARFYINLPVWDYWNMVEHYARYRAFDARVLWEQHNEHRIIFPECIFAVDMLWFQGRLLLPTIFSFGSYLGVLAVMAWALLKDKRLKPLSALSAIAVGGIMMGWKGSVAGLGMPFLLQWSLLELFAILALAWLVFFAQTGRKLWLALAIASLIGATYSSGNGMVLWLVILAAALLLGLSRLQILAITVAAGLSIGFYFFKYEHGNSLDLRTLLTHPVYLAGFVASYVSMPFGALKVPWFGLRVGGISLAVMLIAVGLTFRARLLRSPTSIVLFGYCAFVILSALIAAGGRMNPADAYYIAPKADRYILMPMSYWAALAMAAIWILGRSLGAIPSTLLAVVLALTLLRMFPKLGLWYRFQENAFANQQWAALCVENGIMDATPNSILFSAPGYVVRFNPVLRANRLAMFSDPAPFWLGRPLKEVFPTAEEPARQGAVVYTFPLEQGLEVVGWTSEPSSALHPPQFVFVDQSGRIVGLGEKLPAGLPDRLWSSKVRPEQAWTGVLNLSFHSRSFSTFWVDPSRKSVAPMGGVTPISQIEVTSRPEPAAILPDVTWQNDGGFVPDLIPPKVDPGDVPFGGFLSSWVHQDQSTGVITSSAFVEPAENCLVLPVLHGPSTDGLSVQVIDADTGQSVDGIPLQDSDTRWRYLRVPLAAARQLKIVARDNGSKWGQWIAVGRPAKCR